MGFRDGLHLGILKLASQKTNYTSLLLKWETVISAPMSLAFVKSLFEVSHTSAVCKMSW